MTPLILIVGFLGAGKTTLLRQILPEITSAGLNPLVIINDYQNAQVDALLLKGLSSSIQPISGSCVCCGSREELLLALKEISLDDRSILLIETNGTTDAESLIELLALASETERFTRPVQISVVDAKRWQHRHWNDFLERNQTKTASFTLINRTDEVSAARSQEVLHALTELNPKGRVVKSDSLVDELVNIYQEVNAEKGTSSSKNAPLSPESQRAKHPHEPHHHEDQHHFASMEAYFSGPVAQKDLEHFMATLPREIIRSKGLVELAATPGLLSLFQYVQNQHPFVSEPGPELRFYKLPEATHMKPMAIFIGSRIPEPEIRRKLSLLSQS